MSRPDKIPVSDRFFEIRFESIGGLGAHAAGQILGAAAVIRMGFNGAHFSSYGSEKKGTPVRSNVRIGPSDLPLRNAAPVEIPDVVVIFHELLLRNPATIAGVRNDSTVIYNAPQGIVPEMLKKLPKGTQVVRIDALKIAVEEKSRPNAVLLGTLSALYPFLAPKEVLGALCEEFAGKHPEAVASNERAFNRGGKEFEVLSGIGTATADLPRLQTQPVWGWKTAPMGGALPTPGNSAWNDLTPSRMGFLPVLDQKKCINCGVCDLVCPDLCLVWEFEGTGAIPTKSKLKGVDYRYCKGCFRCVESCPTGAFSKEPETPGLADKTRIPQFPEFVK
jgi:pyruvate ferredoxin oxidoreductase gamma subunit